MKLKLISKKNETPDVVSFVFEPAEKVEWQPGQFYHYVLHHEPTDERGSDRWFTISSAPFEQHLQITTRFSEKSSSFKKALQELEIGGEIEGTVVDGDFTLDDPNKQVIFIAGGIGITPYRSILKQLDHSNKAIHATLLYSNKDQNVPFKDELEEIAKRRPTFKIHYIFSPEHIDEAKIKSLIPDLKTPYFYISGPEPMVENLGKILKEMGIAEDHIKQDWFPGYPLE